jgi:hypothetical protein
MLIACCVGGVHAVGLDRQCAYRLCGIFTVQRALSGDVVETAMNPADVKMPRFETDRRMNEVVIIFVCRGSRLASDRGQHSDREQENGNGRESRHESIPSISGVGSLFAVRQ